MEKQAASAAAKNACADGKYT
ncbi:hypothetical protein CL3_24260 [butyrate-producing bacterium SM4/1]|nr:hypothetical protein CL3_24260 [butyrate-producing bacterium SM4/1]